MWGKIRKWTLCIGFIIANITIMGMAEAGTFESPKGLLVLFLLFFYVILFATVNLYRK